MRRRFKFLIKTFKKLWLNSVLIFISLILIAFISKKLENLTKIKHDNWFEILGVVIGAAIPVLVSLEITNKSKEETKKEQEDHIERIIDLFLYNEIIHNLKNVLKGKSGLLYDILTKEESDTRYLFNFEFKTEEFEKIKYEIIKHDNEKVKDIIELYSVLTKLKAKRNLDDFKQDEYEEIKNIIIKNINKYCD